MKKMLVAAFMGISLLIVDGVSYAATTCDPMTITYVTTNSVRLRNDTGQACGNLAANGVRNFLYDGLTTDRQMAVALTAMSLEKTVFANFTLDSAEPNAVGILNVIAVSGL
jgi:hypothetical protein